MTMQNLKLIRTEVNVETEMVSVVLRVPRQTGSALELTVPRADLADVKKMRDIILNKGGFHAADLKDQLDRLVNEHAPVKHYVTERAGWYDDCLVTRYGTFGDKKDQGEFRFDPASDNYVVRMTKATAESYKDALGGPLSKSNYLVFALAAALAPALADRIGRDGGYGFNFSGMSSTGKTLSLRVCLSAVTRARDSDLTSFGDTTGSLLEQLPAFGALAIPFTDPKAAREKERDLCHKIQTIVFGAHDKVQRRQLNSKKKPQPRFFISLFNSERPLADIFQKAGVPYEGGEAVRLIDIPVPEETGIFDRLQDSGEAIQYADQTERAIAENYGVLLPEWVAYLSAQKKSDLSTEVERLERQFIKRIGTLSSIERRMARAFALVAVAGHLAAKEGLFPVAADRAPYSCLRLCKRALERLSGKGLQSHKEIEEFIGHVSSPDNFPMVRIGERACRQECQNGFRRVEDGATFLYVKADYVERFFSEKSSLHGKYLPWLESKGIVIRPKNGWTAPIQQAGLDRERYMKFNLDLLLKPDLER